MTIHKLTAGDDVIRAMSCTRENESIAIDSGATVRACLVSDDVAYGTQACLITDSGADWPAGVVGIAWPAATTIGFPLGLAVIEVEITDGHEETWYSENVLVVEKHL